MTAKVKRRSSGILAYRRNSSDELEVLLVHPGGPFWAKKDEGAWSVPKGEFDEQLEQPLAAALREFAEETGITLPEREWLSLGSLKQPSGKVVDAWAGDLDLDVSDMRFGTFIMEWPPRSGRITEFPEVDKAEWFGLGTARTKILPGQVGFIDALINAVGGAAIVTDAKSSGQEVAPHQTSSMPSSGRERRTRRSR